MLWDLSLAAAICLMAMVASVVLSECFGGRRQTKQSARAPFSPEPLQFPAEEAAKGAEASSVYGYGLFALEIAQLLAEHHLLAKGQIPTAVRVLCEDYLSRQGKTLSENEKIYLDFICQ